MTTKVEKIKQSENIIKILGESLLSYYKYIIYTKIQE